MNCSTKMGLIQRKTLLVGVHSVFELLLFLIHNANVEINIVVVMREIQSEFVAVESIVYHIFLLVDLSHNIVTLRIIWIQSNGFSGELLSDVHIVEFKVHVSEFELEIKVLGVNSVGSFQVL